MLPIWCVGFFLRGSKAEYTVVFETEQDAERVARKLAREGNCRRIAVWQM